LIIDYCPRFRGDDNIIWLISLRDAIVFRVENVDNYEIFVIL